MNMHQSDRFLNASLLAGSTADYSRSQPGTQVAQVGLDIIGDMLVDSQIEPTDLSKRLAAVTAVLLSPVPTTTPVPASPSPQPTAGTKTSTLAPAATPTAPLTVTPHSLPTATSSLPAPTATPQSTSTPVQVVTPTTVLLIPTNTAHDSHLYAHPHSECGPFTHPYSGANEYPKPHQYASHADEYPKTYTQLLLYQTSTPRPTSYTFSHQRIPQGPRILLLDRRVPHYRPILLLTPTSTPLPTATAPISTNTPEHSNTP